MRKHLLNCIVRLWITSGLTAVAFVIIFVTPAHKAKDYLFCLMLATLVGWLFEQGAKKYEVYRSLKPQKVKAWVR